MDAPEQAPRRGSFRRRVGRTLVVLVVGALMLVGGPWVFVHASTAKQRVRTPEAGSLKPAEVALVLGAAVYPDGSPSTYLQARLDAAVTLWKANKVKAIVVSGDNRTKRYNEPEVMRTYLIRQGIPAAKIVSDYAGRDTYDSCTRAQKIFGLRSVIVVTQTYHLPRAVATCKVVGLDTQGLGDDSVRNVGRWRYGQIREVGANMKMVVDFVTDRQPILGDPDPSARKIIDAG